MFIVLYIAAKETEKPVRAIEKQTSQSNLIPVTATTTAETTMKSTPTPTIIATSIPAPIEVLPPELPLIREEPKLNETQVPIKKYYGRKRDNNSSSSETELSYDETDPTEKIKYEY